MKKILIFIALVVLGVLVYKFLHLGLFYLHEIVDFLASYIDKWGYFGVFALMFLESSFFPFPSEVVMIPAGFLAYSGKMNLVLVIIIGTLGSLFGALFNYFLALRYGRKFFIKYGKYFFVTKEKFVKFEEFFLRHGEISTFSSRLIPGIRQYISLPAGLARMNLFKFSFYTSLGAGIWVSILVALGYFLGQNQELIHKYLTNITLILLGIISLLLLGYFFFKVKKRA